MTPAWVNEAACRGKPIDWFFPDAEAGRMHPEAKALCEECPVRAECLDYALHLSDGFGLWAGMSPRGRRIEQDRRDNDERRVA
jgi:WhiB family redox-sensing transcriptional regulator